MTREELLALVNKEVDTTKFKELSQKTIDEELDDVLEDFGDDEEANSKLVTKLANRLKRINGNLHKNISDEVKKSKEEAERKKKEEEEERKRKEAKKGDDPDDKYSKLLEKLEALEKANAERDKKAARKATIESVKAGLKDKFDKANLEMKNYFLNAAIAKLEIPDEDADIDDLVSKAEKSTPQSTRKLLVKTVFLQKAVARLAEARPQMMTSLWKKWPSVERRDSAVETRSNFRITILKR